MKEWRSMDEIIKVINLNAEAADLYDRGHFSVIIRNIGEERVFWFDTKGEFPGHIRNQLIKDLEDQLGLVYLYHINGT